MEKRGISCLDETLNKNDEMGTCSHIVTPVQENCNFFRSLSPFLCRYTQNSSVFVVSLWLLCILNETYRNFIYVGVSSNRMDGKKSSVVIKISSAINQINFLLSHRLKFNLNVNFLLKMQTKYQYFKLVGKMPPHRQQKIACIKTQPR